MRQFLVLLLFAFSQETFGDFSEFEGSKVYELNTASNNGVESLKWLRNNSGELGIDFWKLSRTTLKSTTFMVPAQSISKVENALKSLNADYQISVDNLAKHLSLQNETDTTFSRRFAGRRFGSNVHSITTNYLGYDEILPFLNHNLHAISRPGIRSTLTKIGTTFEGREIVKFEISSDTNYSSKEVILIDAGIHAREHTSIALALYIINELANNPNTNELLEKYLFVIIPVLNPDGYEYSRNSYKMWRKNRKFIPGSSCKGVDGNRNFDAHWAEGDNNHPCKEDYKGPHAFSEQETQSLRDVMEEYKGRIKMYISIHTYGNSILYPYAYTFEQPKNIEELRRVADAGCIAVFKKFGERYICKHSHALYLASGGSDDYAYDSMQVPLSFTFELGREEFRSFTVPLDYLQQTLKEGWTAIQAMAYEASSI